MGLLGQGLNFGGMTSSAGESLVASAKTYIASESADDGYCTDSGTSFVNNANLWTAGVFGENYRGYVRFSNVTIPNGATITSAYVSGECETSNNAASLTLDLHMEDVDDAAQCTDAADVLSRDLTTAKGQWINPGQFTQSSNYDSPDFTSAVQEVVDRVGWASGQAMQIHWKVSVGGGNNYCALRSYDNNDTKMTLHIEWEAPVGANLPYEDLGTYTLVDATSRYDITDDKAQFQLLPGNLSSDGYLYYDFGAGNIGNFEIQWETEVTAISGGGTAGFMHMAVSNELGTYADLTTTNLCIFHVGAFPQDYLEGPKGASVLVKSWGGIGPVPKYWNTWTRTGTTLVWTMYDDAERTSQIATNTRTGLDTAMRYLMIASGRGQTDVDTVSGYVQNVNLVSGF